MPGIRGVLSNPKVYELWSSFVGGRHGRNTLVMEHVRPNPGARVLDLGCGPGELVGHLGDVDYTGVDLSEAYIAEARRLFGERAEFRVGDATSLDPDLREFDIVLAFGVLHHLEEAAARHLLEGAKRALVSEGRFVSVDPTLTPGQSKAARLVVSGDRGQHVRAPEEYEALAGSIFGDVKAVVRTDLLRIPYTHCVLECS